MPVLAAGLLAVLVSGSAQELVVGVDPDTKVITGYYESGTGQGPNGGPRFTCIFFLRGEAKGEPPYRIRTWYPEDKDDSDAIDGKIWVEDGTVAVHLESEHGGCWNVNHFADEEPAEFFGWEKGAWRAVRVVSAAKAYFHDEPDPARPRKAYLVTHNVLRVFKTAPGWVYGEFVNENRRKPVATTGWIRESDLFADTPPPPAARPKAK